MNDPVGNLRLSRGTEQIDVAETDIAVIGVGLRFPGAEDAHTFWNNLKNRVESIHWFSDMEMAAANPNYRQEPNFVRAGAVLKDVECFDADFFGYTRREAEMIDPQHRFFLECAWEAFEDAGYAPQRFAGAVGVYAGCALNTYLINNVHPGRGYFPNRSFMESAYDYQLLIASEADHLTSRVSYKLNLRGTSINLQAACATSLVSVHMACQALLMGECEMALAGGSTIRVPQESGYLAEEGMVFSPDGHTRTFDRNARGTVFGSGVAAVLLKPLRSALADRDAIYAVIKGTAVNNDGSAKVGFTAPSVEGQVSVIRQALDNAAVLPESISYVEAHGTGTSLGDPIEIAALAQAFATDKRGFCALGSVKTNIGHIGRSSGMASLIKTVLALKHGQLPPSLHFETPNPQIDFGNTPFYVNTQLKEWSDTQTPRRAGVSAFGMGGTNAHVVLQEAPEPLPHDGRSRPWHVLALSARNEAALQQLVKRYTKFLDSSPSLPRLGDICHTANAGREHFQSRLSFAVSSIKMLRDKLVAYGDTSVAADGATAPSGGKKIRNTVAFLFSGQGSQYEGMSWQLYETQPTFRHALQQCHEILSAHWDVSLLEILDPKAHNRKLIHDAAYTQGALFSIEYALARLWMSWGVKPDFVMGHSVGEYAAAAIAEVFSLEDGLRLIAERGRLFNSLIPIHGKMVAVGAGEEHVKQWLEPYAADICIAALNGPANTVISGHGAAVDALCKELKSKRVSTKSLPISRACHSALTEPVLPELYKVAKQIRFSPPRIPIVSNVTGELAGADLGTPEYWCRHTREAVRFSNGMQALAREHANVFIEMGPDPVLLGMGAACLLDENVLWLPTLRRPASTGSEAHDEWQCLASSVAAAYKAGCQIDWEAFDAGYSFHRVRLPTYPFQRQRYWIDPVSQSIERTAQALEQVAAPVDHQPGDVASSSASWGDWLLKVKWIRQNRPTDEEPHMAAIGGVDAPCHWLVLSDRGGVGDGLVEQLASYGKTCTQIYRADFEFKDKLARFLALQGQQPYGFIYLWALDAPSARESSFNGAANDAVWDGCAGLVTLVQAAAAHSTMPRRICVVTRAAQAVLEGDGMDGVLQAPLWPLAKVISMEYPDVKCTRVDLSELNATQQLVREVLQASAEDAVAFRGTDRYVARLTRAVCAPASQACFGSDGKLQLSHPDGVFLITGGLGELGLIVAQWLSRCGVRRLALVGRNLPGADASDVISKLRQQGVEVIVAQVDVAKLAELNTVFEQVEARGYPLVGVVHAAGTFDDGVTEQQNRDRFQKTFSSKVQGAWNLHRLIESQKQKPDYVVLFSSVASLLGNAGQASYAAANGFLDGLSHYRRAHGQACIAVNWGVWKTPGTLRRLGVHLRRLKQRGYREISVPEGLAALRAALTEGSDQIGVIPMEWTQYLTENDLVGDPFFALLSRPAESPGKSAMTLRERIAGVPEEQRYGMIRDCVRDHVMHVIGLRSADAANAPIDEHRDLSDYGVDSLSSIELKNRLQKSVGHALPITILFEHRSIASISGHLHQLFLSETSQRPTRETAPAEGKALNLSLQQQLYWRYMSTAGSDRNVLGKILQISGRLHADACARSIEEVVRRHESLRTRFEVIDDRLRRIIDPPGGFRVSVEDFSGSGEANERAHAAAHHAVSTPFCIVGDPLFRACLLKISDEHYTLVMALHHIVGDGVSMEIINKEISALYTSYVTGLPLSSQTTPTQYGEYISLQSEWLESQEAEHHREYWKGRLNGVSPEAQNLDCQLKLREDASIITTRSAALSGELIADLEKLGRQKRVSLFVILLTAYNVLISRWSGRKDILVVTPNANRTAPETNGTVGFIAQCLLLRAELSSEMNFDQALRYTQQNFLEAYSHQDFYPDFPELMQGRQFHVFSLENHCRHAIALTGVSTVEYDVFPAPSPPGHQQSIPPLYLGMAAVPSLSAFATPSPIYMTSSQTFLSPPSKGLHLFIAGNLQEELQQKFCDEFIALLEDVGSGN